MRDVADLVAEDRRDLQRVQVLDQGVGQQDVAEPGQGPCHPGVDQNMPRVPDQDVRAAEPVPLRQVLKPVAERAGGQGMGRPGQADEQRR